MNHEFAEIKKTTQAESIASISAVYSKTRHATSRFCSLKKSKQCIVYMLGISGSTAPVSALERFGPLERKSFIHPHSGGEEINDKSMTLWGQIYFLLCSIPFSSTRWQQRIFFNHWWLISHDNIKKWYKLYSNTD